MKLSERAQKIADTHGHEWMAERIVELEDIRDAQILVTAFTQDDKDKLESALQDIMHGTKDEWAEKIARNALEARDE